MNYPSNYQFGGCISLVNNCNTDINRVYTIRRPHGSDFFTPNVHNSNIPHWVKALVNDKRFYIELSSFFSKNNGEALLEIPNVGKWFVVFSNNKYLLKSPSNYVYFLNELAHKKRYQLLNKISSDEVVVKNFVSIVCQKEHESLKLTRQLSSAWKTGKMTLFLLTIIKREHSLIYMAISQIILNSGLVLVIPKLLSVYIILSSLTINALFADQTWKKIFINTSGFSNIILSIVAMILIMKFRAVKSPDEHMIKLINYLDCEKILKFSNFGINMFYVYLLGNVTLTALVIYSLIF